MLRFIRSLSRDERGVSALEYAVLGGIVVACLVAVGEYMSGSGGAFTGLFKSLMSNATSAMN
jgi:pilus assembly protein Flp/PilA